MKKFQFSVFAMMIMALVCVGFASCGDDDDSGNDGNSGGTIVGTWYFASSQNIMEDGERMPDEFYTANSDDYQELVFKNDNTFEEWDADKGSWGKRVTGTYSLSGNKLTITAQGGVVIEEIKWISNDEFMMVDKEEDYYSEDHYKRGSLRK